MPILKVANVHHDALGYTRTQTSTPNTITWYTNNVERMNLDSTGNLSLGRSGSTTGLGVKLDVVGSANTSQYYINGVLATAIANSYGDIAAGGANGYTRTVGAASNTWANSIFTYANTVLLGNSLVNFAYTGNLNMTTGSISIGRSDPVYKIDVVGAINASSILINNVALSATGSGGGDFNTNIANSVAAQLSSTLTDIYTAPATVGKRYIVRSIHVTNISVTDGTVTGEFQGATYSNTAFCATVPVPTQSAVELLRKPKVLQPSDILRLQSDASSTLHVTIAYEIQTSNSYFGAGADITAATTYTDLYTATGNAVLESVLLANDDTVYDTKARVVWTDGSNNIQGYFCYDMIIPADSTVEVLDAPKNLPNGYKVRVWCANANRLEAMIAGKLA